MANEREELINPVRDRKDELAMTRSREDEILMSSGIRGWALAAEPTATELDAIYYAWSLHVLRVCSEERGR